MKPAAWLRFVIPAMLAVGVLCPPPVLAQVPARSYWKTLSGANAVPLIVQSMSGNTNPFDPSFTVNAGGERQRDDGHCRVSACLFIVRSRDHGRDPGARGADLG